MKGNSTYYSYAGFRQLLRTENISMNSAVSVSIVSTYTRKYLRLYSSKVFFIVRILLLFSDTQLLLVPPTFELC